MRALAIMAVMSICLTAVGCHSAVISVIVSNHRDTPVTLVEVDYPSASFGIQELAPGAHYLYKFKVIGNGPATLLWNEPTKRDQKSSGPVLREGDEGSLTITFPPGAPPTWNAQLQNHVLHH
ncbi:MAG TPA: hypothetical protein VHU44_10520 [Acidobacteriaceae bacterium]|jgi:hypothetical protein|nr:hypothetical protein [Acidobacteriaceae bacterium]